MNSPEEEELLMLVRRVIQASELPKAVLARDANVSRHTLNSWVVGERTPRRNTLLHLAGGLRRRAELLQELAEELTQAAEREKGEGG